MLAAALHIRIGHERTAERRRPGILAWLLPALACLLLCCVVLLSIVRWPAHLRPASVGQVRVFPPPLLLRACGQRSGLHVGCPVHVSQCVRWAPACTRAHWSSVSPVRAPPLWPALLSTAAPHHRARCCSAGGAATSDGSTALARRRRRSCRLPPAPRSRLAPPSSVLPRRQSAEEPILAHASASSEIELSDAGTPLSGHSPLASGSPRLGKSGLGSSRQPGFATIAEEAAAGSSRGGSPRPAGTPRQVSFLLWGTRAGLPAKPPLHALLLTPPTPPLHERRAA